MNRDAMKFKHLPQYKGNSKIYVEGIIDEIYDDFEKQTCKNCNSVSIPKKLLSFIIFSYLQLN